MSVSKSDHPLPVFTSSTEWDDFVPKFITHIGLFGLDVYWDESNIPASDEPDWLPTVSEGNAVEFLRHVRDIPANRALIPGLRHNTSAENGSCGGGVAEGAGECLCPGVQH